MSVCVIEREKLKKQFSNPHFSICDFTSQLLLMILSSMSVMTIAWITVIPNSLVKILCIISNLTYELKQETFMLNKITKSYLVIANYSNSVIHREAWVLLYVLQFYNDYIYHAWPRWAWSYTVGPQLYLRGSHKTLLCIYEYVQLILTAITHHIPGSDTLSCKNEGLFLFSQTVVNLQPRVAPAGFRPFRPRNVAARSSVDWPNCTN